MIYCRKCGNQMPDDSVFCNKCGCNQNESIGNSASPSEASLHPNDNNENSLCFRYNEKVFNQNIFWIITVLICSGIVILISKNETLRGWIVFFDIIYAAGVIWSCIRVKNQILRINNDTISGIAGGLFSNTEVHNLSIKRISNMQVFKDTALIIYADKPYTFNIENAEKARMELHKKIHNN